MNPVASDICARLFPAASPPRGRPRVLRVSRVSSVRAALIIVAVFQGAAILACSGEKSAAGRVLASRDGSILSLAASDSPGFLSADVSIHVERNDSTARAPTGADPTIHMEHRRLPNGSWESRSQLLMAGASGALAGPAAVVDAEGIRVYSAKGELMKPPTPLQLRQPARLSSLGAATPPVPPEFSQRRAGANPRRRAQLGSPVDQFVARQSTAHDRRVVLEARFGTAAVTEGANHRYRGRLPHGSIDILTDSATGAVLQERVENDDGSVVASTHTYSPLPSGGWVRNSTRREFRAPNSSTPSRVVTVRITNVVIR